MSKRRPIVAPLALAAILAIGFGVVWAVLVFWGDQIVGDYIRSGRGGISRQLYVAANGRPLVVSRVSWEQLWHTLEGEEIVVPPRVARPPLLDGASLASPGRISPSATVPWNKRIVEFVPPLRPLLLWYFIHDGQPQGAGYFVAYDVKTKLCAGYFGTKGHRLERPPVEEWFPVDGRLMLELTAFNSIGGSRGIAIQVSREGADPDIPPWRSYLISGTRLLEIDFKEESVRTVLETEGLVAVNLTEQATDASAPLMPRIPPELPAYLALRMPDRVLVIYPSRAERRSYVLPDEVRDKSFRFYELSNQTALLSATQFSFGQNKFLLYWIDPAGKVLRREEVIGFERTAWSLPTTRNWVDAAALPSPLALVAFFATEFAERYHRFEEGWSYSQAVAAAFSVAWPALAVVVVLSAGLTILVWRRQRRYAGCGACSAAGTLLWMVFVILGGVPGLLAYWFHRRWPVLQECPACGKLVPHDRGACARCSAEFPAPAPKGTEVFAT